MRCLREADDHLAHSELADKLETAMENDAARRGSQVGVAWGVVRAWL